MFGICSESIKYLHTEFKLSYYLFRMYGNYITEDTYGKLAEQYYAALHKKESSILWIECQHLEDLSKEEIYNLLKISMDSFSLADI